MIRRFNAFLESQPCKTAMGPASRKNTFEKLISFWKNVFEELISS